MDLLKKSQFWVSVVVGILLFSVTFSFYHDMYIAQLFTALCVCLNAASAVLFSTILYQIMIGGFQREDAGIFLWFLILQGIGHGIFTIMNWGSWLFLALTVTTLIGMAIAALKHKI